MEGTTMNYEKLQKIVLLELFVQLDNFIPAKENMQTYNENQYELIEALYAEFRGWA